ncbi:MAG: hypothetical protein N2589_04850 [bacterium]|nr:hypothetical protein [bacterium]
MKCKKIEKRILDFIEQKINKKGEIEKHIEKCEKCRNLYNNFLFILKNSKKIQFPLPDENFWRSKLNIFLERKSYHVKIKSLCVSVTAILVIFLATFFTKIYNINSKKYISGGKIEILNHELPLHEEDIIQFIDYIDEEEAEKILDVIFKGF